MGQLTQGMYSDFSCNLFGLMYGQQRGNEIIRNAGWFNSKGEKIGCGDLSLKDISRISQEIDENNIFFALSESDVSWNMPSDLDPMSPSISYVANKAKWVILFFEGEDSAKVYEVRDNHPYLSEERIVTIDSETDIHYTICQRNKAYDFLSFDGLEFSKIRKNEVPVSMEPKSYYGLDVYQLADGKRWAVATYDDAVPAAKLKIKDDLWSYTSKIAKVKSVSTREIDMICTLVSTYGKDTNSIILRMLTETELAEAVDYVYRGNGVSILSADGSGVSASSDVRGLPNGFYAFRI